MKQNLLYALILMLFLASCGQNSDSPKSKIITPVKSDLQIDSITAEKIIHEENSQIIADTSLKSVQVDSEETVLSESVFVEETTPVKKNIALPEQLPEVEKSVNNSQESIATERKEKGKTSVEVDDNSSEESDQKVVRKIKGR